MTRAELIAETAIALLAERGMRGLTHRAVDEAAGLPAGSTSNLARTRAALLELTLARLTRLEHHRFPDRRALMAAAEPDELAAAVARMLHLQLTRDRRYTLARFELALEANRRPELRAVYDEVGRGFRAAAAEFLAACGSADPVRHGHRLVAFAEGLMFDALAGAGDDPGPDDLRLAVRDYLAGVLR